MKVLIIYLFFNSLSGLSQEHDHIDHALFIVDTTTYNGDSILVFNDKSWEYLSEYNVIYSFESSSSSDGVLVLDSSQMVKNNWNTNKTFSSQYNLSSVEDSIRLNIKDWVKPVNAKINSEFKFRWGRWHKGNDYAAAMGTKVYSSWGGIVRYAKYNSGGYGNLVIIRHYNGLETYYAHLSKLNVIPGQIVLSSDIIGLVGNTGASTGPHLHYEIRFLDNALDPKYIKGELLIVTSEMFKYLNCKNTSKFRFSDIFVIAEKSDKVKSVSIERKKRRRTAGNL